jgi:hypothetical protein
MRYIFARMTISIAPQKCTSYCLNIHNYFSIGLVTGPSFYKIAEYLEFTSDLIIFPWKRLFIELILLQKILINYSFDPVLIDPFEASSKIHLTQFRILSFRPQSIRTPTFHWQSIRYIVSFIWAREA